MRLHTYVWHHNMEIPHILQPYIKTKQSKLRGMSPRANYTDLETAACRRSWCQLLQTEGCRVVSAADPYGRNLGFLDRSRYIFFQVAPQLYSRSRVVPV
jgi:hypothetical protein